MRHTCLRITTLSVVCAGFFYSVTPQAQARSHAMTEMEADRLTLSALTAPPPPVRHVVYRHAISSGRHATVTRVHHVAPSSARHSLVHEVSYRPHATSTTHHARASIRHRT